MDHRARGCSATLRQPACVPVSGFPSPPLLSPPLHSSSRPTESFFPSISNRNEFILVRSMRRSKGDEILSRSVPIDNRERTENQIAFQGIIHSCFSHNEKVHATVSRVFGFSRPPSLFLVRFERMRIQITNHHPSRSHERSENLERNRTLKYIHSGIGLFERCRIERVSYNISCI